MAKITRIKARESAPPDEPNQGEVKKRRIKASSGSVSVTAQPKAAPAAPEVKAHAEAPAAKSAKISTEAKSTKQPKESKRPKGPKAHRQLPAPIRVITWPFRKLGTYIRDSWLELRQVRWPNAKATWKMMLAILIYTAIIMVLIMLLDALFTLIFNAILG